MKSLTRSVVCDLPTDRTLALDEFVVLQENSVKQATSFLTSKNLEVEMAVMDLFQLLATSPIDPSVEGTPSSEITVVKHHFNSLSYQALLNSFT